MEDSDIRAIEAAISRLKEIRADIFGANEHGFQMNPALPEAEVASFERDHKIALPPDYRQFLTCLGNGGAGPFYGVFPLGLMDANFDLRAWQENDGVVGDLLKPFTLQEEWNDLSGQPDSDLLKRNLREYDRQVELFDASYWSSGLVNGAIPICHEGCALRIWLVVTGKQAGKLWEDRRSEYAGLRPVRLTDGSAATLFQWYKEWLYNCFLKVGRQNWR